MQKSFVTTTVFGILLLCLGACSKKTTAVDNTEERTKQQQPRQARGERPQFSDLLSQMDKNKDGKLSQVEVQGPLKENFSQMDQDKNGYITESEFKNAPAPPRRGRR